MNEQDNVIKTQDLGKARREAIRSVARRNKVLAKQMEIYFKGMAQIDESKGVHTGFSLRTNTNAGKSGIHFGEYLLQFQFDQKDISLNIPIIAGNNTKIGYTGANLNVRRVMLPVAVVETGQDKMTYSVMQRNEYFLRRFNEEVLPLMQQGKITGTELRDYIKRLKSEAFVGQQATSGRAFTANQAFAQQRYEQQIGGAMQLVTRQTMGLVKDGVPAMLSLIHI